MPSLVEALTLQFYEWEKRGRGWYVYGEPVDLEPPFEPFWFKLPTGNVVDDGAVPGIFSQLLSLLSAKPKPVLPAPAEIPALAFEPSGMLRVLSVSVPKAASIDVLASEQLLLMLSSCRNPVSFEIVATAHSVAVQFVCRDPDYLHLYSQLKAYFPDCIIQEKRTDTPLIQSGLPVGILDLGLKDEFMLPLAFGERFTLDPLTGLFGMMEQLLDDERCIVQVLFKGAVDPWPASIISSVSSADGSSFFMDAPDMPKLARSKVSSPLFGVTIRAISQSANTARARSLAEHVGRLLIQATLSPHNSLIFLSNNDYPHEWHIEDVMERQSHRLGMLINSSELVQLVHLPSASVISSKLCRDTQKTKAAPQSALGSGLILGTNVHQGHERRVAVSQEQRLRHIHIIGATGTGKTTLLEQCINQDIAEGRGLAVLDPHGDLIESILNTIPRSRISDVVLIDPSDVQFPVGFNILSAHSDIEKEVLSSDLISVFRRLSTSWGDQMNSIFANAILAFLENTQSGTLMDLRRFLVEKSFRDARLKTVTDPNIVYYWQKEYPLVRSASIGPILSRLDTFLRPKTIRNMVGQQKSLNFEEILNTGKILLVKLSQGLIGDENSYLLGTLMVSKIYQAAMARQAQGKETRTDFALYVDEFQNFITPSMAQILSGARKYHLGLVLAHQDMQQLVKDDMTLAHSVISNAGTRICFRLGDTDAKRFEDGFSYFNAEDLQNLATGEAICRIERREHDFNLQVSLPKGQSMGDATIRNQVMEHSRSRYATAREEVERLFVQMSIEEPIVEAVKPVVEKPLVIEPQLQPVEEKQTTPPVVATIPELDAAEIAKTTENFIRQKELSQHRYLQTLIKRMAEARGFKAVIEQQTPDGKGQVDVSIERDSLRIACEIGVTTSKEWELHNVEKCLHAGYGLVVAIANDAKGIEKMNKQVAKLDEEVKSKVRVMLPEEFFVFLEEQADPPPVSEKRIKGYRVKVNYATVTGDETKSKRDSITKVVLDSVRRKKKDA